MPDSERPLPRQGEVTAGGSVESTSLMCSNDNSCRRLANALPPDAFFGRLGSEDDFFMSLSCPFSDAAPSPPVNRRTRALEQPSASALGVDLLTWQGNEGLGEVWHLELGDVIPRPLSVDALSSKPACMFNVLPSAQESDECRVLLALCFQSGTLAANEPFFGLCVDLSDWRPGAGRAFIVVCNCF